jgi:prophage regulatory protein
MQSLIRLPEVERRTSHSCSEIYKRMHAGTFPRPVKIGRRAVAWVEEEIDRYVKAKIAARDQPEEQTQ